MVGQMRCDCIGMLNLSGVDRGVICVLFLCFGYPDTMGWNWHVHSS